MTDPQSTLFALLAAQAVLARYANVPGHLSRVSAFFVVIQELLESPPPGSVESEIKGDSERVHDSVDEALGTVIS